MDPENLLQISVCHKNEFNISFSPAFSSPPMHYMLVCVCCLKHLCKPLCKENVTFLSILGWREQNPPLLWQRVFERVLGFEQSASENEGKMPLKACGNDSLRSSESNQGWRKGKWSKCSMDKGLKGKGDGEDFTLCVYLTRV
jgi:hypothetical protein